MAQDDAETSHRRARLRELFQEFGTQAALLRHIADRTGKKANQGELAAIAKPNSGKSFGDKKAKHLTEQIGLPRNWFSLPLGTLLDRPAWKEMRETAHTTDPKYPPVIRSTDSAPPGVEAPSASVQAYAGWPFALVNRDRYLRLDPEQQRLVQERVNETLTLIELGAAARADTPRSKRTA